MQHQETDLYRHYDADKNLLYVGISLNTAQRLYQHMRDSRWASEISSIEVERLPSRQEAIIAEEIAIKKERPLWNVIHNRETKREKGACKPPAQKTPKKASRPKAKKPNAPFNMESLEVAIGYSISKMSQLRMMSHDVNCTEDVGTSTFVKIKINLPGNVRDDDVGLDEFMSLASLSPYPRAYISMMTGYTFIDERHVSKSTKITLITPGWLRRMLYGDFDLSQRESRSVIDGIDGLLAQYERAFFEFLSIEKSRVVSSQDDPRRKTLRNISNEEEKCIEAA